MKTRISNKNMASLLTTGLLFLLLNLILFGCGGNQIKIDINDQAKLEEYIQGQWSWEKHTGDINHTWRYRFEIKGNKIKVWTCMNNMDDPFDMSEGYEEFTFSLGSPTRDVDGYHARYFEFPRSDNFFGLTYEAISPVWIISDDYWKKPVIKSSSGIPSWSKDSFQPTGKKIEHND